MLSIFYVITSLHFKRKYSDTFKSKKPPKNRVTFVSSLKEGKEANGLFNDALNTFLFTLLWKEGRKCFI